MRIAKAVEAWEGRSQDRAEFFERGPVVVLVVADGAGGIGGGAEAAEYVVRKVEDAVDSAEGLEDSALWSRLLAEADAGLLDDLESGETTAVVAACSPTRIVGASVGDSGCWLLTGRGASPEGPAEAVHLTHHQQHKPLLGSGRALPIPFESGFPEGTVLVASDGLLKYSSMARIVPVVLGSAVDVAVDKLVDLVRLRSGCVQDDVSVILCRKSGARLPA